MKSLLPGGNKSTIMKQEDIVQYCLSKRGAWADHPFGPEPLVIKVASKMFAIIAGNNDVTHISLKCDPETAYLLRQEFSSVKPGYHLNKMHWNTVTAEDTIPNEQLLWMIDHSYDLVARSLPKSKREELGMDSIASPRKTNGAAGK
ncbi:MmcQ/YjbR family DNA-binding protein [Paenibacillus alkalitolerans]|uniref:MmcQ/YjbR family DNA-binding protein n=1 Tax=Paenibacillus alkalitolerans TaxID=2799335 RepID=UPI001F3D9B0B|nr:MmcQ/YjbR family DNA-binding protein [Paenibacillus alkalitolerans]